VVKNLALGSVLLSLCMGGCVVRNQGACTSDEACDEGEICYFESPEDTLGECVPANGSSGDDGEDGADGSAWEIFVTPNNDLDILFVIDNSGSMSDEQQMLAVAVSNFIDMIDGEPIRANYRIGITTTDNGNPWCSSTTPEGGALQASSCLGRLDEFIFPGTDIPTDTRYVCTDICVHETIEIAPTTTEEENTPAPRPWIESINGVSNVVGATPAEAFACFAPQGIRGCGFESQLESMYKGIRRAVNDQEASYGFLRQNALLAVIILTDEADCSYRVDHEIIFLPEGNRVFWSDPDAEYPTSAVCWNAGVSCTGGPGTYDECHAQDKDEDGDHVGPEGAVLHPLSRYVDVLQNIENEKKTRNPNLEVLVSVIAGVPDGYPEGQDIVYQDTQDVYFQGDFGIGPGCESATSRAVPPVRMRELAEAFMVDGERNLFSVCAGDYAPALDTIMQMLAYPTAPGCMPGCVADADDDLSNGLSPSCELYQETPGDGGPVTTDIPECDVSVNAGTWDFPSASDDVCFRMLTKNTTPTTLDDISDYCLAEGTNLEFVIERRPGTDPPGGTVVFASCEMPNIDEPNCPGV
jgi:hypothetical protein